MTTANQLAEDQLLQDQLLQDQLPQDQLLEDQSPQDQLLEKKLIEKKQNIQQQAEKIIAIADNEDNSALKCIHLLSVAGGATSEAFKAIEQRIVADQDNYGAYHLALIAQSTPDLPIDARQLIDMVVAKGDNQQLLSLLKNLPLPPVDAIKQRIIASEDGAALAEMTAYLQANPDGYGSNIMLGSGQKDRIVPLSER